MKYITPFNLHDWESEEMPDSQGKMVPTLINKLMEYGILPSHGSMFCPHGHNKPMVLQREGKRFKWRCYFKVVGAGKLCNYGVSLTSLTFFAHSHMPLAGICKFVSLWLENIKLVSIQRLLEIGGTHTVVDWAMFCREVTFDYLITNCTPMGGPGKTVEIDESMFGNRKYNRGRHIEGQWVFGGFDRETGNCFMVPVMSRDSATLLSIIRQWILPGTTIISDCWKAYDCLKYHGYIHLQVNHTYNFVDPTTGAHTNSIEGAWSHAKNMIPRAGRKKLFYAGYLSKYMFLRKCKLQLLDPFKEFCRAAGNLYNPMNPTIGFDVEDTDQFEHGEY